MNLKIFNTLSKKLESFIPLNETVKVYACGPTVYNYPHIGNARPAIIGDILIRILRNLFKKVVYVRNITDIDDKINDKAKEEAYRAIQKKFDNLSEKPTHLSDKPIHFRYLFLLFVHLFIY